MLRISIHDEPGTVTFKLEGRLAGCWVGELHDCFQTALAARPKPAVRFDLTQVTSLDAQGKAFLSARNAEGAALIAAGCFMRAIVAEITSAPRAERDKTVSSPDAASPKQSAYCHD